MNVTDLLKDSLAADRRPPDGKLHCSSDLIGSLRHAQLRAAGAPTIASELVSDVRMMTGTMWHNYFENLFRKHNLPVMTEVRLDPWLPEGWAGIADWLIWNKDLEAFELHDLKTIKGEGMPYIERDGIKVEHLWQVSAYWHACYEMGLPLLNEFTVFYLPQNVPTDQPGIQPLALTGKPFGDKDVLRQMTNRWKLTQAYLEAVEYSTNYLTDDLAAPQERLQALRWNSKQKVYDVKLIPHWSAAYCPYPDELCDCSAQGTTKIGHYAINEQEDDGFDRIFYEYRNGYEDIDPIPLSTTERKRLERA